MRTVAEGEAGVLGTVIKAAGRFRPTERIAARALRYCRQTELLPRQVQATINGRTVQLDLNEMVDAKIFTGGAFDRRGLGLMRRLMQAISCRTALDIGANIGNHTAFFADWARQVYAFEPNPVTYARLHALINRNGIANVVPIECGLSNRNGSLSFFVHPGAAHLATLQQRDGAVLAGTVPVRKGDDVVREKGIGAIDFIKIDVEGHEYEALHGLQDTLARDRPLLVMEFEPHTIRKFGSAAGLATLFDQYRFFGTKRSLHSKLLKDGLALEPLLFGKSYAHMVCVPTERMPKLAHIVDA